MKTIDERETQKKQQKLKTEIKKGGGGGGGEGEDTEAIVKGRVLNDFVVSLT